MTDFREALTIARAALQSVAQEREDRRAIEAWLKRYPMFEARVFYDDGPEQFRVLFADDGDTYVDSDDGNISGTTLAKAISAAATWARAEMAK